MDAQTHRKLRDKIKLILFSMRIPTRFVKDLTSDVMLDLSEQDFYSRTKLKNKVIDACRKRFGRAGTLKSKANMALQSGLPDPNEIYKRVEMPALRRIPFFEIIDKLDGIQRIALTLRYVWGMTEAEIAYCFGVTEPRICQVLGDIHKNQKKILLRDVKPFDSNHPHPSMRWRWDKSTSIDDATVRSNDMKHTYTSGVDRETGKLVETMEIPVRVGDEIQMIRVTNQGCDGMKAQRRELLRRGR